MRERRSSIEGTIRDTSLEKRKSSGAPLRSMNSGADLAPCTPNLSERVRLRLRTAPGSAHAQRRTDRIVVPELVVPRDRYPAIVEGGTRGGTHQMQDAIVEYFQPGPVCNAEHRRATQLVFENRHDAPLADFVQRGARFVQKHPAGLVQNQAREADQLQLTER